MATIFSKIINGEIPSYKVAEDEKNFAFLDINPLSKGHTLVVPKKEVDYIFDLDPETYEDLFHFVRKVAKAIQKHIPCKRVGVVVYGLDIPHAHVHLIPLQGTGNEIDFAKIKLKLSEEEFVRIADGIYRSYE
jgi:histidine triad (HIT) family protein